jgi:hypothetical protein
MFYNIEKLPDAPVIIGTWYEGFKFVEHGAQFDLDARALMDKQKTPIFYVLDLRQLHTISIEGIMEVAHTGAKVFTSAHRHPKNRGTIIVSKETIIKLAVKGVASAAFGNMNIRLFETLEEVMEYIKNNSSNPIKH